MDLWHLYNVHSITGSIFSPVFNRNGVSISSNGQPITNSDIDGSFSFSVEEDQSYDIVPAKAGFYFDPPQRTVVITDADVSGVDYYMYSLSPNAAVLATPTNGDQYVNPQAVTFSWSYVPDPNYSIPTHFNLYLSGVAEPIAIPYETGVETYNHTLNNLQYTSSYTWSIVPVSAGNFESTNNQSYSFTTIPLAPVLELDTSALQFYQVDIGQSVAQNLSLSNKGGTDLEVFGLVSTSPRYTYNLGGAELPLIIPSLQTYTIQVVYTPTAVQQNNALFYILSNDPTNNNTRTVNLSGAGYHFLCNFEATPISGDLPLEVQFTPLTNGEIFSYLWNFGDGTESSASNPLHTYTWVAAANCSAFSGCPIFS